MQENNTAEQTVINAPDASAEPQSEQTSQSDQVSDNHEVTASYGKFKSLQGLLTGYQQLEKEFTKKCQTLKELENRVSDSGQILDKMLAVNPKLADYADKITAVDSLEGQMVALAEQLIGGINEPGKIIEDEDFLDKYVYANEHIVEKIVANYLDSLAAQKIPSTIARGGNSYVSSTYRPRSLDEAAKLAKKFIETRRF